MKQSMFLEQVILYIIDKCNKTKIYGLSNWTFNTEWNRDVKKPYSSIPLLWEVKEHGSTSTTTRSGINVPINMEIFNIKVVTEDFPVYAMPFHEDDLAYLMPISEKDIKECNSADDVNQILEKIDSVSSVVTHMISDIHCSPNRKNLVIVVRMHKDIEVYNLPKDYARGIL